MRRERVSWVGLCLFGLVLAGLAREASSEPLQSYATMLPLAGDAHRHAGSAASHLKMAVGVCNDVGLGNPHERGLNIAVYDALRSAGYDWANLAYHDYSINAGAENATYLQWIAPGPATPLDQTFGFRVIPSRAGFPDWTRCGDGGPASQPCAGATGANEARSHSTAARLRNVPGQFAAFAGREYTSGSNPHTVVIPPGDTDTVCGLYENWVDQTAPVPAADKCGSESALYEWINRSSVDHGGGGGVLIRAHPLDPAYPEGQNWHPLYRPTGFSDRSIQGMEVGKAYGTGPQWEAVFQKYLAKGHRLFPSYGSDGHALHHSTTGCRGNEVPRLQSGATICWVDSGATPWDRPDVIRAMRERRCYYSSAYEPRLEVEACGTAYGSGCAQMGGTLDATRGEVRFKVRARNDPRGQRVDAPFPRRFDRVEVVKHDGAVLAACTNCCTRNNTTGDVCEFDSATLSLSAGGAAYVRICGGANPCGADADSTSVISSPVFVNWTAFRASVGQESSALFDADGDGIEAPYDNCIEQPNPTQRNFDHDAQGDRCDADCRRSATDADGDGQYTCAACVPDDADADADGIPDACDNCASIANGPAQAAVPRVGNQTDTDADGVGDACDSCVYDTNPEAVPVPGRTNTGGQRDDDADGFGNACDPDFDNDGVVQTSAFTELQASNGRPVTSSTCGTSGAMPCDRFDFDGYGLSIEACVLSCPDTAALFRLIFAPGTSALLPVPRLGPKCADCGVSFDLLPCAGDECDPDRDGVPHANDNCPFTPNPTQADGDGDRVGDACDNCVSQPNPRVPLAFLAENPWATLTGGQRDDDRDGYGNQCDAKFPDTAGTIVSTLDLNQLRAATGKPRAADLCGLDERSPCAVYDLNEVGSSVGGTDLSRFRELSLKSPGPKCPACPLPCVAGTDATCAPAP
jgi:hypothetical protein